MNKKRAFICGKIKVSKVLTIPNKGAFMSIVNTFSLQSNRQIKINFDGGDLSSDAGLLYSGSVAYIPNLMADIS